MTLCMRKILRRAVQRLEKLGEGALDAPEDVYVDAAAGGAVYTATRDGWLQRMHPNNGSWGTVALRRRHGAARDHAVRRRHHARLRRRQGNKVTSTDRSASLALSLILVR